MKTTLNLIGQHEPCKDRWKKLIGYLGSDYPLNKSIDLLTILKSNGVADTIWALRATIEDSQMISICFTYECALEKLPIFEKEYPKNKKPWKLLKLIKQYIDGEKISEKELRNPAHEVKETMLTVCKEDCRFKDNNKVCKGCWDAAYAIDVIYSTYTAIKLNMDSAAKIAWEAGAETDLRLNKWQTEFLIKSLNH